jgi:hypothetical protein
MMHVIIEIADHLNQFKNDSLLRDVMTGIVYQRQKKGKPATTEATNPA